MPTEDALRQAAGELKGYAASAEALLDEVTTLATEDLWTGPVADRFAIELGHHRGQLRTVRDELLTTASQLEHLAEEKRRAREAAAAEAARQARLAQERREPSRSSSSSTYDPRFVR